MTEVFLSPKITTKAIGIREDASYPRVSAEEQRAVELKDKELKFARDKYEAPILRETGCPELENNCYSVLRRTRGTEKRLARDVELWKSCKAVISSS